MGEEDAPDGIREQKGTINSRVRTSLLVQFCNIMQCATVANRIQDIQIQAETIQFEAIRNKKKKWNDVAMMERRCRIGVVSVCAPLVRNTVFGRVWEIIEG